jgi:hypothetical protein
VAYAPPRSMNASLEQGMTDGSYKKVAADRGGFPEVDRRARDLADLDNVWYGFHECEVKVFPDGSKPRATRNYADTGDLEMR